MHHSIGVAEDAIVEKVITFDTCYNYLPESVDLETSVDIRFDQEGRIVYFNTGIESIFLDEIKGPAHITIKTKEGISEFKSEVTSEFYLNTLPVELLINEYNPKIGDVFTGSMSTNTKESPSLIDQFFAVLSDQPYSVDISGTIAVNMSP